MFNYELDFVNHVIRKDGAVIAKIEPVDTCAERDIEDVFNVGSRITKDDLDDIRDVQTDMRVGKIYKEVRECLENYIKGKKRDNEIYEQMANIYSYFMDLDIKD